MEISILLRRHNNGSDHQSTFERLRKMVRRRIWLKRFAASLPA
jgi:hypothetical protein